LGPRPEDAGETALWNRGVNLIYSYRQRNRVMSVGGDPLGPKPSDPARRRERQDAALELRRIQNALKVERHRVIERDIPGIAR
jgi:hypothetical protein